MFKWLLLLCLLASGSMCAWAQAEKPSETNGAGTASVLTVSYPVVGTVAPRAAKEIHASNWSVGAETMDRDYTIYANWKQYLGPLGAKKARIQAGWAKTERVNGQYDWAWLDAIVRDMVAQGVEPWVCLCYGNPLYAGGTILGSNPSTDEQFMAGWLPFVDACVARYGDVVDEWEIWNEPRGGQAFAPTYAAFLMRTAETIRHRQPKATIIGCATVGIGTPFIDATLAVLRDAGKLDLVDQVSYHPYSANPDSSYPKVAELRGVLAKYTPHPTVRQGENGCPSTLESFGALAKAAPWDEVRQAKWLTRRLLGDLGHDIPSSYFSICDMVYRERNSQMNTKGLLATNPDQTVNHPKVGYAVMQRITAIFDDRLQRIAEYPWQTTDETMAKNLAVFGYRRADGQQAFTLWRTDVIPGDTPPVTLDLTIDNGNFTTPVLVDLLSGTVYDLPAATWSHQGPRYTFRQLPVYDAAIVIADRSIIPLAKREP